MTQGHGTPKILIVDDQRANRFALRRILSKINVEVIEASNGNDALASTLEHELALILLDVQMPEMDGYEVATLLRSNEDTSHIPIIFVTAAYKDDAHRVLGYGAGAVDYVEKPIDDAILLSKARVFIDLYERKRELERTLGLMELTNRQLKSEIIEHRAAETALKQAKLAAEAASVAKSTFLANMSHELRTPLNAVLGYAQILQNDPSLSETQRQGIITIRRSGEYLLTLINDILDLAKVESGHLELYPQIFNVGHFFSEINDMFRIRAAEKGLLFHYQPGVGLPAEVNTDEKRLRQICVNLLGNAMKFTEHGEVQLQVNYQDGNLIICVIDSGIGIPESMCEQIFKPFVQTGENKYKQQGTGLGLAISRNLIERMGGHIELKSETGHGSCFKVIVPVAVVSMMPITTTMDNLDAVVGFKRTDGATTTFQVLVVDDIAANRAVLRGLLEPLGFIITEASDGSDAVTLAATTAFDVILMDLVMPKVDGLTATKRILEHSNNTNQIIIALTASAFEDDRVASISIGCKDYLIKPLDRSSLLQILRTYLPLEWEYNQPAAPMVTTTEVQETPLTTVQRESLVDMVQRGAIHDLVHYLERLRKKTDCPSQAQLLLTMAKEFKLADMRRLLES